MSRDWQSSVIGADDWMFLAVDTGFHDNNPFNVSI
jgi:hypothetical protein